MTRTSLVLITGFSSLLLAQSASAQPRWGRERVPNQGACFYEDRDFRGRYFCVRDGDSLRTLPSGMSDRISSVRVLGGAEVTVFRDTDMRGRSTRLVDDVRDLKRGGWNDQISSIEVYNSRYGYNDRGWPRGNGNRDRDRGYGNGDRGYGNDRGYGGWNPNSAPVWSRNGQVPREGACFYEDANFRGAYFCVPSGASYNSLPRDFNDRISSVRVFGAEVRLFQDSNFRGRSTGFRSDVRDLRGNWRDSVSSIRVF